jgi:hypothetical protein
MKLKDIMPLTEEAEKTENTPAFTSAVLKKSNQYKKALERIVDGTSLPAVKKIAETALK